LILTGWEFRANLPSAAGNWAPGSPSQGPLAGPGLKTWERPLTRAKLWGPKEPFGWGFHRVGRRPRSQQVWERNLHFSSRFPGTPIPGPKFGLGPAQSLGGARKLWWELPTGEPNKFGENAPKFSPPWKLGRHPGPRWVGKRIVSLGAPAGIKIYSAGGKVPYPRAPRGHPGVAHGGKNFFPKFPGPRPKKNSRQNLLSAQGWPKGPGENPGAKKSSTVFSPG